MSDIQRWNATQMNTHGWQMAGHESGTWVTYEDHLAEIAKVREDERSKHAAEVNELRWMNGVTRDDSYAAGLRDAARAAELKTRISVYELSDEYKAYNEGVRAVVAAIEALGGER